MTDTLPISEVFGPTYQGEGPSAGQLCAFIRLGGCNLTCRDCDTPYTWDASRFNLRAELTSYTAVDILAKLCPAPLVVISGGEPTMYRDRPAMADLLTALTSTGRRVEIETNGTIDPAPLDTWPEVTFNVSPKLDGPMSDDPAARRLHPAALTRYADLARDGRAVWKLVVADPATAATAAALVAVYDVPPRQVWLMPVGVTVEDTLAVARRVADFTLTAGFNLSLRQHILLWPDIARGR